MFILINVKNVTLYAPTKSPLPVDHAALEVGPDSWCLLALKLLLQ